MHCHFSLVRNVKWLCSVMWPQQTNIFYMVRMRFSRNERSCLYNTPCFPSPTFLVDIMCIVVEIYGEHYTCDKHQFDANSLVELIFVFRLCTRVLDFSI